MPNAVKFILGKKLNMSQVFTVEGEKISVSVIQAGPCKVVAVRSKDKDGHNAVQLGFGVKKHLNKPQAGHQKTEKFASLREFRVASSADFSVGQAVTVQNFAPGDIVDASGIMKGRGFAGAMKRHGFHGMPMSHGHNRPRSVGSIGSRYPQHTLKGTRMAGRMGGRQVTVRNLTVVDIDPEKNLLWISGAVPGTRGGLVKISSTGGRREKVSVISEIVPAGQKPAEAKAEENSPEKQE